MVGSDCGVATERVAGGDDVGVALRQRSERGGNKLLTLLLLVHVDRSDSERCGRKNGRGTGSGNWEGLANPVTIFNHFVRDAHDATEHAAINHQQLCLMCFLVLAPVCHVNCVHVPVVKAQEGLIPRQHATSELIVRIRKRIANDHQAV